ncbi:MAG: hypothetical protein KBF93_21795 [Leptospiraceae bacterium]|nr:hypothetical protein [Leptospiraceae bacterium]
MGEVGCRLLEKKKRFAVMRVTMIVKSIYYILIIFSITVIPRCNVWNDISAERRGCDFKKSNMILVCGGYFYLDQKPRKEDEDEIDKRSCLNSIYSHEECKKKLRENTIP